MAGITFGGLATGMDTNQLIEGLMEVERLPVTRLESKKTAQTQRVDAFKVFDTSLKKLRDTVSDMSITSQVRLSDVTLSNEDYFSASSNAGETSTHQVEVIDLAQVGKQFFQGYDSKTDHDLPTGSLTLNVNGTDYDITVDSENNSLVDIAEDINDLATGVKASVMFDGDNYRLTLTGDDVSTTFSLTDNLSGGGMAMTLSQPATRAHVKIDGLDVYSDTNTIEDAVPNLTLNLTQAQEAPRTPVSVTVGVDEEGVKEKVQTLVDAYNEVMEFIADGYNESALDDEEGIPGGLVLRGDSSVNSVKRKMQSLLTTSVETYGSYSSLVSLGVSTNRNGTLSLDSSKLEEAIQTDFDSVVKVLVGDDNLKGVMKSFKTYMYDITSSADGVYANAKDRADRSITGLDDQIYRLEARLEQREISIRAQFTSLETLVSGMNQTSSYLTQQMDMLSNLWSNK